MKHILLSLMLIPVIGWGQKKDSSSSSAFSIYGTTSVPGVGIGNAIDFYIQDTMPVLMLVCDTGKKSNNYTAYIAVINDNGKEEILGQCNGCVPYVWWMFGYSVSTITMRAALLPSIYLDEKKKPLSKSLVVWISKNR